MARLFEAVDTTEPFSDVDLEMVANMGTYHVVSGCALDYDAANMTVDIAAGVIVLDGVLVIVAAAANAVTMVSDGSNPRWAWIHVDSSGTAGITHGTAAATPAKPELGNVVAISAELIATSATIANDQTHIVKRIPPVAATGLYQPTFITNNEHYIANGGVFDDANIVWTTTNMGVYTPVSVNRARTIKKLYYYNGATVGSDNVDVGVYAADGDGLPGARMVSIGPTATAGASAWQAFDIADTDLAPGLYYLAAVQDGVTDKATSLASTLIIAESRRHSIFEQAIGSGTLPSTASPAIITATRMIPQLALSAATT
ncbi:hypothetical protein LCGC14_0391360 [marine sediment metagenome]|uniref:Uncharacterized protein n=1 Tax=marine sediment metagenome TaxID=412755 RepID=A0A0F9SZK4_9ZZZZ